MNRLHEASAAAATAALLLTGHEAQAAPQPEQAIHAEALQHAVGTTSVQPNVLGGPDVVEHVSVNNGVETTVMDITDTRPWASHFSQSPEASEQQTDPQRQIFTFGVNKLLGDGKRIEGVSFQGTASDEAQDRSADQPTAGLGVADPENVTLADTRAHAVGTEDEQIINKLTGETVPVTYKPGVEIDRSDLAAQEVELARQLHMTPAGLMQKFNTNPASLPETVRDTLSPLVSDRHVIAEITATRQLPPENPKNHSGPTAKTPAPNGHDTHTPEAPAIPTPESQQTVDQPDSPHNPHHGVDQPAFIAEDAPMINDAPVTDALPPASGPVGYGNSGQSATTYKGISGPQHVVQASYATSHKQPRPYNFSGNGRRHGRTHGGNINR